MRGPWLVVIAVASLPGCKDSSSGAPDAPAIDARAQFTVGGRVANVLGSGLVISDGTETLAITADQTFAFTAPRTTGTAYAVTVVTQPSSPEQVCTVTNGSGTVSDDDVTDVIVECSVGTLRITEISTCYFANVPCWFEVHNTSPTEAEQLSAYRLRASAVPRTGGANTTLEVALPSYEVPPGGYAIVRGRATDDFADGRNVLHVVDGGVVPFWKDKGFLELTKSTKTVDFVRLGNDTTMPATIGWTGTGPAVPSTSTYGSVIARGVDASDSNTAADFQLRAFATPGGPNDITDDTDADLDGIPDQAEVAGGTFAGLDLYAMGVRTNQRDILVEIDYMTSSDPGVTPRAEALAKVVEVFGAHGITLHLDVGELYAAAFDPAAFNLGGGNSLPFTAGIELGDFADARANLYELKAQHMDVRLHAVAHYAIFGNTLTVNGEPGNGGTGELGGNDVLVTLGATGLTTDTAAHTNRLINYQAATLMHELGHNLGLDHGGADAHNYKPNYVSVMNYLYAFSGLPTIGTAEGDRYAYDVLLRGGGSCGIANETQLTNSSYTTTYVLDFSSGTGMALNESALVEGAGLRRPGSTSVDFNCDGSIASSAFDVNHNGAVDANLTDHDDWANLRLPFQRGVVGVSVAKTSAFDPFTDERRPAVVEHGFRPPVR